MAGNESLADYYQINFILLHKYNYSLEDLESMIPFEREIYLSLIEKDIKEKNDKLKNNAGSII